MTGELECSRTVRVIITKLELLLFLFSRRSEKLTKATTFHLTRSKMIFISNRFRVASQSNGQLAVDYRTHCMMWSVGRVVINILTRAHTNER